MRRFRRNPVPIFGMALAAATLAGCLDHEGPAAPAAVKLAALVTGPVITVQNADPSGPGSLAEALSLAADGTTIDFDPALGGQTIALSQPMVVPAGLNVTVEGPAGGGITLDAGGSGPVLQIEAGATVILRNLTITGGVGDVGGGIVNLGDLTLENCTVTGNQAVGQLGATVHGAGGGIESEGPLTLINSTVSGNTAETWGGGIFHQDAYSAVTVRNSTVVDNSAGFFGGGIFAYASGTFDLRNSIVANNDATGDANCFVDANLTIVTLDGVNLTNDGTKCINQSSGHPNFIYADPIVLGALADNGGPTMTHALLRGSPAIDAAPCATSTDQRYVARPQGLGCDIGAFEFDGYTTFTNTINPNVVVNPNTGEAVITGWLACSQPALIDLTVSLTQDQKTGRLPVRVSATDHVPVDCNGTRSWSIVLSPAPAAFRTGSALATATSPVDYPNYLEGSSAEVTARLFWGHK